MYFYLKKSNSFYGSSPKYLAGIGNKPVNDDRALLVIEFFFPLGQRDTVFFGDEKFRITIYKDSRSG